MTTTVGHAWTEAVKEETATAEAAKAAKLRARIEKTIAGIPEQVQNALRLKEPTITLWAPLENGDTLLNNLRQLDKNIRKAARELSPHDLRGGVQEVVQWCVDNDLVPFLHHENVSMVGNEWSLRARRRP